MKAHETNPLSLILPHKGGGKSDESDRYNCPRIKRMIMIENESNGTR